MMQHLHARKHTLAQSDQWYRAMVDSLPGPAFLCSSTGEMSYVAPQIESLLGYTQEEWLGNEGRFWMQLIHSEDRPGIELLLGEPEAAPATGQIEIRLQHKNGDYRWIEGRFTRFTQDNTAGIILDVHERRQNQAQLQAYADELGVAYQELQETQQQLVQSAKLATIGELSAGVAHEIDDPLAAIRGLAQVLAGAHQDQAELAEPLHQILINTDRMTKIIRHLRRFARQASSERTTVKLNELVEEALILLHAQLDRHQIELIKDYDSDLPPISCVPYQLMQVMVNLITNARDAILAKERPGRIVIRTWHSAADGHVHCSIADTGVGIAPENRTNIFAPFFTTKKPGYGTGLGLPISFRIIQEHQGQITFDSQYGTGSTFTILLPTIPDSLRQEVEPVEV